MAVAHVYTVAFQGSAAQEADVELHIGDGGNGVMAIMELADQARSESRERLGSGLAFIGQALLPKIDTASHQALSCHQLTHLP